MRQTHDKMQNITNNVTKTLIVVCSVVCLWCCKPESSSTRSDWVLTQAQRDSIAFSSIHHYNTGTNFVLKADSLVLYSYPKGWDGKAEIAPDSFVLEGGNDFVVTEIYHYDSDEGTGADSVWLCLVSDEAHPGWTGETTMLEKSSPVSPISQFIYTFSDTRVYVFITLAVLMTAAVCYCKCKRALLWFVHFRDITSFYPCAFTVTMSTASMIYSTLQKFAPEVWTAYYFNPSLNPFNQPAAICIFLISLWLSVLFLLSVVFDIMDKEPFFQSLSYVLSLICAGCVMYVILALTVPYYAGYLIYVFYVVFSIGRFSKTKVRETANAAKERPNSRNAKPHASVDQKL